MMQNFKFWKCVKKNMYIWLKNLLNIIFQDRYIIHKMNSTNYMQAQSQYTYTFELHGVL